MQITKVYWRDIAGIESPNNSNAWLTRDQAVKEAEKLYNHEYETVGEIIAETNDFIVIAATTDNGTLEPLFSDLSMIMKSVIIRMEKLKNES